MAATKKSLTSADTQKLLKTLEARFQKHMNRHTGITWAKVQTKLQKNSRALQSLQQMEETGGEPDVIDQEKGEYVFVDCSPESPDGRRSLCYDNAALLARKEHKPKDSAVNMAKEMGIELLTEEQYRKLQTLGTFDTKTSSWVATPPAIRKLGGALFCDRRYDTVFLYHNGAKSYYAARGFRGRVRV